MIKTITLILLALVLLTPVSTALAYVGPGAGMSVLGSLLSILATIVVATGAIIIWPLRKFMKRRKARRKCAAGAETVNTVADNTRDGS
jgi:hypothetical protein